jgi:tetratricopeptide (TPR) repeat protein
MLEDYEVTRKNLGEVHPEILTTMSNLGKCYLAQGKNDEAVRILEKAAKTSRKVLPPGFFGTGITLQNYGNALAAVGRDREAEQQLLDAYAILEPTMGADHPGVQRCAASLEKLYEKEGRARDAALWKSRTAKTGT